MNTDAMYLALRPRTSRAVPVTLAIIAAALLAWCAWCCVLGVRAYRDTIIGKACAEAGHDFAFGDCRAPDIAVHIDPPRLQPPPIPAPWQGPLGPGGM